MIGRSGLLIVGLAAGLSLGALQEEQPRVRFPSDEELALGNEIRALLNEARDAIDLPVLIANPQLELLAYQHSAEMAQRGQVSHHSHLYGVSTKTRLLLAFPRLLRFAENVARNRSPQQTHEALMVSEGHRMNRIDPSFTHVGIGVARAGPYQIYVTELFARAGDPSILERIELLYTEAPAESLPRDDARHGEIVSETVHIPRPTDSDPEYWTDLGIGAYNAARYDEAVAAFEHALRLDPTYQFARFDLGRALLARSDGAAAIEVLRGYLESAPDDLDAWGSLGSAALLEGRYDVAERAFRRVLATRRRDAISWYNLGLALEYTDRPSEAENAYVQALFLDSSLVAAAAGLARVRR